jgi:bile acid:Na+ symporter, BASS family
MLGNSYITIGLPVSLFIIMIGMGLSLTVEDFRRVKEQPKGVIVGTVLQLVGVPLLGFAYDSLFRFGIQLADPVRKLLA